MKTGDRPFWDAEDPWGKFFNSGFLGVQPAVETALQQRTERGGKDLPSPRIYGIMDRLKSDWIMEDKKLITVSDVSLTFGGQKL